MKTKTYDSIWLADKIFTLDPNADDYGVIEKGALGVNNGRIAWLGRQKDLVKPAQQIATQVHDFNSYCMTPGLIDCHTHLVYAGNRYQEFEQSLTGINYATTNQQGGGIYTTVAATRNASFADLLQQSAKRLAYFLNEGVTTIEIKSGYGLDKATEIKMLQVAKKLAQQFPITIKTTFLGAHMVAAEYKNDPDAYIDFICEKVLPEIVELELADAIDGFCDKIAFTPAQITRLFSAAQALGLPCRLHADQLNSWQAAQTAAACNALSADHLEFTSADGIAALAAAGTVAVLLPGAYYCLQAKQLPPIDLLRQHQVPIAIATDCNPGSSPVVSILSILNLACRLFRLTPVEAWRGVTCHAAKALGLEKSHGSLSMGKVADFAVWDIEHPGELCYQLGINPLLARVRNGVVT